MGFSYFCQYLETYSLRLTASHYNLTLNPPGLIQSCHLSQCVLVPSINPRSEVISHDLDIYASVIFLISQYSLILKASHVSPGFCLSPTKSPIASNSSLNIYFIMFRHYPEWVDERMTKQHRNWNNLLCKAFFFLHFFPVNSLFK